MKSINTNTPYFKAVSNGCMLIIDLLAQIFNLINSLQIEISKLKTEKDRDDITARALRTSILVLQFSTLETTSNFLAELTIETNKGLEGSPEIVSRLTQAEIDLLAEQRTYVDIVTGEVKSNSSNYIATMDKLAIVPLLFGRLHGKRYRLDKSVKGWQNILKLKEVRDKFIHYRINISSMTKIGPDFKKIIPTIKIENKDLFVGAESIQWYQQQIVILLRQVYKNSNQLALAFLNNQMIALEMVCWMMLSKLYKSAGISDKEFARDYPPPAIKQWAEIQI